MRLITKKRIEKKNDDVAYYNLILDIRDYFNLYYEYHIENERRIKIINEQNYFDIINSYITNKNLKFNIDLRIMYELWHKYSEYFNINCDDLPDKKMSFFKFCLSLQDLSGIIKKKNEKKQNYNKNIK